jgi:hypothetical protein
MKVGTTRKIENLFDGNICRCTGDSLILQAQKKALASDSENFVRFENVWDPCDKFDLNSSVRQRPSNRDEIKLC